MFVVNNKDFFKTNSDVHTLNTRFNQDLHFPVANLTVFQKGVWYSGIKLYNHLPSTLKQLSHDTSKFRVALKNFLSQTLSILWGNITVGNKEPASCVHFNNI
jgi:hypothetical protein